MQPVCGLKQAYTYMATTDALIQRPPGDELTDEELQALLAQGADPAAEDCMGRTALHRALLFDADDATVRRLARVTPPELLEQMGVHAVMRGRLALFFEIGGRLPPEPASLPWVHVAIRFPTVRAADTLRLLLERGADPDALDMHGRTALAMLEAEAEANENAREAIEVLRHAARSAAAQSAAPSGPHASSLEAQRAP